MGLGNVFGGSFGNVLNTALPILGAAAGSLFGAPQVGAVFGSIGSTLLTGGPQGPAVAPTPTGPSYAPYGGYQDPAGGFVAYGDPNIYGTPSVLPIGYQEPTNGEIIPAAVPAVAAAGLTRSVLTAIAKLAGRLGIGGLTAANAARVGMRIWRALVMFARRHPALSLGGMLSALGLGAQEAAEFLLWGQTRMRRRRRRGVSARDLATTRRTLRTLSRFRTSLGGGFAGRRRRATGGDGVTIARAG